MPLRHIVEGRLARILSVVFMAAIGLACSVLVSDPRPVDFLSFWGAGSLGERAYDLPALKVVQETVVRFSGQLPFPYPPAFLIVFAPFAALPFGIALVGWVIVTASIYIAALRRFDFPAVVACGLIGQAAFLTTALFAAGLSQLQRRPLLGGALLGCLVIKPQLAVLIPLALAAGAHWRAFGAAAASSVGLSLLALLIFGIDTYAGFFAMLGQMSEFLSTGMWPWSKLASVYAFCRAIGVSEVAAWSAHAAVAAVATSATWFAWQRDHSAKLAVLASATVLISPYIFTYDALLLAIPFAWLLKRDVVAACSVWLLSLLPVLAYFDLYAGPNTVPLAALISLFASLRLDDEVLPHSSKSPLRLLRGPVGSGLADGTRRNT